MDHTTEVLLAKGDGDGCLTVTLQSVEAQVLDDECKLVLPDQYTQIASRLVRPLAELFLRCAHAAFTKACGPLFYGAIGWEKWVATSDHSRWGGVVVVVAGEGAADPNRPGKK